MSPESGLKTFLGFRHVIEDGLTILNNGDNIEQNRRNYVLNDLAELMHEATRGSELVEHLSLFVGTEDKNALDTYSLFDRCFGYEYGEDWTSKLDVTKTVMQELVENNVPLDQNRTTAIEFLSELLDNLKRRGSQEMPILPQEIRL